MSRRWARLEAQAKRALERNRGTIEATRTETPGVKTPGGRTRPKKERR